MVQGCSGFRTGAVIANRANALPKQQLKARQYFFLLKQYRHNAVMHRTSFLPWQQLGLDPPVTDGALGSDFQPQTLWPSITECQSVFLLAAHHPPPFFFPLPRLSLRTARDISWRLRACCHRALQGSRGEYRGGSGRAEMRTEGLFMSCSDSVTSQFSPRIQCKTVFLSDCFNSILKCDFLWFLQSNLTSRTEHLLGLFLGEAHSRRIKLGSCLEKTVCHL